MTNISPFPEARHMDQLTIFNDKSIRQTVVDGERMFVMRDVCEVTGIVWSGERTMASAKPEWFKGLQIATPGGPQQIIVGNQKAILSVVLHSNSDLRNEFVEWFFNVCLPRLRELSHPAPQPAQLPSHSKLPLAPPPTLQDRLTTYETKFPVSVGKKHPGRIIGGENRRAINRLRHKLRLAAQLTDDLDRDLPGS